MECGCGGIVSEGRSCYRLSKDNFCFIIENVPAFKCARCGKVLFTDDIVEKINKLIKKIERETNEIVTGKPSVNTYDF
jgi:hypothetical protein